MKKKFIVGLMAVMLIVALLLFAMPVMSPDVDVGVVGESAAVMTADLAAMNSEAVLIVDSNTAPVSPAPIAGEALWLALSVILVTFAVVYRRRLYKSVYLITFKCLRSSSGNTASAMGSGGPNKFILPGAA